MNKLIATLIAGVFTLSAAAGFAADAAKPAAEAAKTTEAAKPAETKPADKAVKKEAHKKEKTAEAKPADSNSADSKPADSKPADSKSADSKSAPASKSDAANVPTDSPAGAAAEPLATPPQPPPLPPPLPPLETFQPPVPLRPQRPAGAIGLLSGGGAVLLAGVSTGIAALVIAQQVSHPTQMMFDRALDQTGKALGTATIVLDVVGASAILVGGICFTWWTILRIPDRDAERNVRVTTPSALQQFLKVRSLLHTRGKVIAPVPWKRASSACTRTRSACCERWPW